MTKTILITGATDGIGLATARTLLELGHRVILHGRSAEKLSALKAELSAHIEPERVATYTADLSVISDIKHLVNALKQAGTELDVLINNAGVFVIPERITPEGIDVRFMVNTIAPYLLTRALLPDMKQGARVINLSSAAQASLMPQEIIASSNLSDNAAYAKSKLALTMWSMQLGAASDDSKATIVAVNPKSFLGSKMVEQAYGVAGGNVQEGADILVRAALSEEFSGASGQYFDNDHGRFARAHDDAYDEQKVTELLKALEHFRQQYGFA
ncbi:SDR family NAD(P)-dependent oxidoreductase [Pseudoalteromonas rubra]|uniref:SDR family NAD(P)-dependent oxidoreductase n=1 Tax=Pseudoalteromonas rubra TaxID=43658 RepID=UPI002DBD4B1A|nr:SDR family NAD(P)-dependent oxidoreductase [Pseudoalteromonas rubra]MEC4087992.1 SDR family NAD(P)-dependent oxidoreductase [Pseudoalteromonas rubra]